MSSTPETLASASRHQPHAKDTLSAALSNPLHAYLFRGSRGTGKRAVARAFAAELLAPGSADPDGARRRVLADPSPHPDLVWLRPPGAQHLVEDVRELVIRGASLRPFEAERRVFVIEAAETLGEESQNALLKTLEEPAPFAHLLLLSSEPELIAETVRSRCQQVSFEPLSPDAVEEELLAEGLAGQLEARAVARLCGGDAELARFLLSERGRVIRAEAERCARAVIAGQAAGAPWQGMLEGAEAVGTEAGAAVEARLTERAEAFGRGPDAARMKREAGEAAKRVSRRERTAALDLGLALCGSWFRDLGAVAASAPELSLNADRENELAADAGIGAAEARQACELTLDTRRRLRLNVSEELALEALFFRLEALAA